MARKSRKKVENSVLVPVVPNGTDKIYIAGLYARISVENEKKREADSIGNQLQLLKDFASEQADIQVFDVYSDDDISGTDFIRPEFSRMMNDVRDGKINCIIVKDLSRLGRNYLESGEYIEMVFPFLGVRFIAITDRFDTKNQQADLSVQLKNMANEMYAKDISKKICSTMRSIQEQGKFAGSKAPYGYLRDPMDKHRFVIDNEAAPIVKELFEMVAAGNTLHYAATTLNARGVPSPGQHNHNLGIVRSDKFKNSRWYQQTVRRILKDPVYLGWLVGGKQRSDFHTSGDKACKPVPQDEWIITKGAHEPIITENLFNKVQEYFEQTVQAAGLVTKYASKSKEASMFKGRLRCGECGKAMFLRHKNNKSKKTWWYYCALHENYNSTYCIKKAVKKDDLESLALKLIQSQMTLFMDARALIVSLNKRESSKTRYKVYQDQIRNTKKQIERYMELKAALYSDFAEAVISEADYVSMGQEYAAKADELRIFVVELEKEAKKYCPEYVGSEKWLRMVEEFQNRTELDAQMVDTFIDELVLYNDGHVEVKFNFKDEIEEILLLSAIRQREVERYAG
jgi:DNA invertase Pin-like site-specific DNA recombinase